MPLVGESLLSTNFRASSGYLLAHDNSATLVLIGKYGKKVVELTSGTNGGGGRLVLNEGAQGYEAVEIGTGENKRRSKGTIVIHGKTEPTWQAP
jgi:hypothetical protein